MALFGVGMPPGTLAQRVHEQRNAALHEWENEGGTEEVPLRSAAAVAPQG